MKLSKKTSNTSAEQEKIDGLHSKLKVYRGDSKWVRLNESEHNAVSKQLKDKNGIAKTGTLKIKGIEYSATLPPGNALMLSPK